MKAAGRTHRGFYRHFGSKDDLIAQTIAHIFGTERPGPEDLIGNLDAYLSPFMPSRCPENFCRITQTVSGPKANGAVPAGMRPGWTCLFCTSSPQSCPSRHFRAFQGVPKTILNQSSG